MEQRAKRKTGLLGSVKLSAAVVLTVAVITGCTSGGGETQGSQPESAQQQSDVKTVRVETVSKQKIGDPLEQVADIVAATQLDVIAKAGGDVLQLMHKRGDEVKAGDVLLRLDPTDMQIQREKASLQLRSGQQAMTSAKKEFADAKQEMANGVTKMEQALVDVTKMYNKARNDYDQGVITKIQLEQAETAWKNQTLDLEMLKQKQQTLETTDPFSAIQVQIDSAALTIKELDRTVANLEVKAPVSGILTEFPLIAGTTIQPGTKVGHIQQFDPVKIKARLTESSARLVRGKTELIYYVPGSSERPKAAITYLSDAMDSQTMSYDLELEVANPDGKLKPGSKVQVQLTYEEEQIVVTVPTLSVVREGGVSYVFVLVGDTVEKRKVELGRLNELNQEVLSGVREGEKLVVSGQHQLKDKEKVKLAETK